VERDARYATVALFALACIAAVFAFVWWYSGRGDRRDYDTYEIYFEGSVSGLSKGSPVRYLGVDVGRVTSLSVGRDDPGRVKILVDIDSAAPVSNATQAKLGFLGLTGLLYIDLQQNDRRSATGSLPRGDRYPVIASRKGSIEASAERLPELMTQASDILLRIERVLADENVAAITASIANLERATAELPATLSEARALAADLRKISATTLELTQRASATLATTQPDLTATLANARVASEKFARTADGLDRLLNENDGAFGRAAGASVTELQQLVVDARNASNEIRELARELRERPSSLLREQRDAGVEMPQ
jgi:phospholipid/cholesterol/gamma-HCH transport system substrate-binding protein